MTRDYFLSEREKIRQELQRLLNDEKGWKPKKTSKSVQVHFVPSNRGKGNVFRAEAILDVQPEKLFDMIHPTEKYRFLWDPNVESCSVLEEVTHDMVVIRQRMQAQLMGLLSSRETVDLVFMEETEDCLSSQFGSVDYEIEPDAECIRAWTYPSGIFIYRTDNPMGWSDCSSRVIAFFQADGNLGHIPEAAVHAAMPAFIENYFNALRKTAQIEWSEQLKDIPGRRNPVI